MLKLQFQAVISVHDLEIYHFDFKKRHLCDLIYPETEHMFNLIV